MKTRKKVRKISLDEMARKYKQSAVEEAGHEAESRKVHDTLAYMTKTLENGEPGNLKTSDRPGRNGVRKDASHALCDGCGRPHWRNEMFVVNGRAYAKDCVPGNLPPLGAEVTERIGVSQDELRGIPRDSLAYAHPEPTPGVREWQEKRNVIQRQFMVELEAERPDMLDLLREHGVFKAYAIIGKRGPSKAGEKWRERLRELGDMPIRSWVAGRYTVGVYGPAREMTASARAVSAWWKEE